MAIFHCYVSSPEGKYGSTSQNIPKPPLPPEKSRWWREHPATLERPAGSRDVVLKKASINAFRDLDIRRAENGRNHHQGLSENG